VSVSRESGQRRVSSLTVTISVVRADNWVVSSAKTPELLSHEQGHYDITGLMGRDMGNEILAARAGSLEDLQQQINSIIERYRQRARELNARYDTETGGGRNRDAQRRWDERIRSSIDNGTPFSAP
jgi:predicted secreted Zn-dependent protease